MTKPIFIFSHAKILTYFVGDITVACGMHNIRSISGTLILRLLGFAITYDFGITRFIDDVGFRKSELIQFVF